MLRFLFLILVLSVVLVFQLSLQVDVFGHQLQIGFLSLLVIYCGFRFRFRFGFAASFVMAACGEAFMLLQAGSLILPSLIVFVLIQLVVDRIYSDSYLTDAFWVMLFYGFGQLLSYWVLASDFFNSYWFWLAFIIDCLFHAGFSLLFFYAIDALIKKWLFLFETRRPLLTGADFFEVKNKHRDYL